MLHSSNRPATERFPSYLPCQVQEQSGAQFSFLVVVFLLLCCFPRTEMPSSSAYKHKSDVAGAPCLTGSMQTREGRAHSLGAERACSGAKCAI